MRGFYKESREITVTERTYTQILHRQARYKLKGQYNETGKQVILTAPGPIKLKPGCKYSVDFGVTVVSDKYEYHLPLERQRRKMKAAGLKIDVKTLSRLCETVAEHCLPVTNLIKNEIKESFVSVHLDESPWKILATKQKGYMWTMSNRSGVYFQFEPTRSGKVAAEILHDFEGSVVVDGYSGYNSLRKNTDIRVGHCWAHARREFYERWDDYPKECGHAIGLIDGLFKIESRGKTWEELRTLRKKRVSTHVEDSLRLAP